MSEPTIELLPCPFCGEADILVKENYNPGVRINSKDRIVSVDMYHYCPSIGLPRRSIRVTGRDYAEAAKTWNTRAALTDKQMERLPKCPKLKDKALSVLKDHLESIEAMGEDAEDRMLASALGHLVRFHDAYHAAVAALEKPTP